MSAKYPPKVLLAFRSGDKCALPDCGMCLTPESESGDPINIGKAAHIAGENVSAVRYDPNMTDEERGHYNNLVYICGVCHDVIDDRNNGAIDYPVDRLHEIKTDHEQKVRDAMTEAFADVGFPELEEATEWILQVQPGNSDQDFSVIPPEDKLKKNDLGNGSRVTITMGLCVAREVRHYVESVSQSDSDFPERLKAGFLEEYYRLKRDGQTGDDLFDLMCQFAQRGFADQSKRTAGLAVLIYLFEACEVFEK
jgi:hypothetical protein